VKALEEAVGHATDRYRQGLARYYEVLEAQRQLYPAQNTFAQIRLNPPTWRYKPLGGGRNLSDTDSGSAKLNPDETVSRGSVSARLGEGSMTPRQPPV
jgi:hypothetical protein